MRYISDDGKIFNTEQECCEHEQKISAERERKRKNIRDAICDKYAELSELVSEYEKLYNLKDMIYFAPLNELMYMLDALQ